MFATDNPGSPGVVGASGSHMHEGFFKGIAPGNEEAKPSLEALGITPDVGFAGKFQIPVTLRGFLKHVSSIGVNLQRGSPGGLTPDIAPQTIRPSVAQDQFEFPSNANYGSIRDLDGDTEGRGVAIESAREQGQFGEAWDISIADSVGPQPIMHAPKRGLTDDVTKLVQADDGEAHNALRSLRHNFPFLPVAQFPPQSVSVNLVAGVAADIILPDMAVAARISWTGKAGNDLFVSLQGKAQIPLASDLGAGNMGELNKGMILNPDDTKYFYVKDIKGFSAICPNACIVNVQCYLNN